MKTIDLDVRSPRTLCRTPPYPHESTRKLSNRLMSMQLALHVIESTRLFTNMGRVLDVKISSSFRITSIRNPS